VVCIGNLRTDAIAELQWITIVDPGQAIMQIAVYGNDGNRLPFLIAQLRLLAIAQSLRGL
jgi:hypothetical protein